jgi:hypothetical protein
MNLKTFTKIKNLCDRVKFFEITIKEDNSLKILLKIFL